ncbi:twitching motility protein PilT [Prosthecobacter debontii]|uniref:Twitching motility protein PilT n=1 Tax=Prosthecobacter debontii TaxID=48467 RepID=A0A1T4Z187_9BACT|nr:ATPase, T2SS/T4P/T4SS family [Prosthecobacter debontii]SKB07726.1 twitching motility protein PilT [Prosthecobacter debontii]
MPLSLDDILQSADEHQASDVFLMEGEIPRMKIREQIMLVGEEPLELTQLAGLWLACGVSPDGETDRDSGLVSASRTRYRVNLHKALGRLGAVMRRIRTDLPVLSTLGVPDWLLTKWAQRTRGLILITGPTGMGKSTTMAGLLQWMNENMARHIVTIEDPVEFIYTNKVSMFTQRDVGRDTLSYARGVRGAMRQAPDVIMVGEIRDLETALITLQASETGHLVLASVHSDSVVDAIDRIAHLFPPDQAGLGLHLLSQQLIGALCQKLIPRMDGGVHLLVEHLENGGAVRPWIARHETDHIRNYMQRGNDPNCITFLTNIVLAYEAGLITEAEAILASGNETEFKRAARGIT